MISYSRKFFWEGNVLCAMFFSQIPSKGNTVPEYPFWGGVVLVRCPLRKFFADTSTYACTLSHTHTHAHVYSLPLSQTHALSLSHTHTCTHAPSPSLSHACTPSHTHTHVHMHPLPVSIYTSIPSSYVHTGRCRVHRCSIRHKHTMSDAQCQDVKTGPCFMKQLCLEMWCR